MPTLGIRTPAQLVAQILETRGGWSWAWTGDQAAPDSWPAVSAYGGSAAALSNAGTAFLDQLTDPLRGEGIGSARVRKGVRAHTNTNFTRASGFPAITAGTAVHLRVVARASLITDGALAQYLEATQGLSIQVVAPAGAGDTVNGDLLFAALTNSVPYDLQIAGGAVLLNDRWAVIDLILETASDRFKIYINGVDLAPLVTAAGDTTPTFVGDGAVSLLNLVSGASPAENSVLLMAALRASSPSLTLAEHREDLARCGVREDGLAVDQLAGWTWAFSANRLEVDSSGVTLIDADPDYGGSSAINMTLQAGAVLSGRSTQEVQREGLGQARLNHAIRPSASTTKIARSSGSSLPIIDGDLHARLFFQVDTGATSVQRLLYIEDPTNAALRFSIAVQTNGDLTVEATSAFTATFASAISFNRWNMLDVIVGRTDGVGGAAQVRALLNGAALASVDHTGTISDIPAGASLTVLNDAAGAGAATFTDLSTWCIARARSITTGRHQIDAAASGLFY